MPCISKYHNSDYDSSSERLSHIFVEQSVRTKYHRELSAFFNISQNPFSEIVYQYQNFHSLSSHEQLDTLAYHDIGEFCNNNSRQDCVKGIASLVQKNNLRIEYDNNNLRVLNIDS